MSALGLIMLPTYTITVVDKSENPGGRQFAWKAVNRVNQSERKYVFAAETEAEMKAWMNFMSLASIAFGSGKASAAKLGGSSRLADDSELSTMRERAAARAGGVAGADAPIAAVQTAPQGAAVPAHLQKTSKAAKKAGRTLALIQLLDGQQLQLYSEPGTTGQNFLDQVCDSFKGGPLFPQRLSSCSCVSSTPSLTHQLRRFLCRCVLSSGRMRSIILVSRSRTRRATSSGSRWNRRWARRCSLGAS